MLLELGGETFFSLCPRKVLEILAGLSFILHFVQPNVFMLIILFKMQIIMLVCFQLQTRRLPLIEFKSTYT